MLLVIFGAGASYDSVPHLPPSADDKLDRIQTQESRPPLANELFGNRREFVAAMETFRECMPLIPVLRKNGVAVEQELAKIKEQAKTFPKAHQELMAIRFYLRLALWGCQKRWHDNHHRGITNYLALLREIERWRYEGNERACFVTFNYDTMLEQAMLQVVAFNIHDMNSYISQEHYSLLKLHGSIDWGRELTGVDPPTGANYRYMISRAADLLISSDYVLVRDAFDKHPGLVPALSIPVDKKDEFSCPEAHVKTLVGLLPTVTKILVIGWRATEAEFINLLQSHLTRTQDLMIVSGNLKDADDTLANLNPKQVSYPGQNRIGIGFTGLINNLDLLNAFLRTPP